MSEFYVFEDKALKELDVHDTYISDLQTKVFYLTNVDKPSNERVAFTSAGTRTWTCPEGVFKVSVFIQGGGQGGYSGYGRGSTSTGYCVGIPRRDSGKAVLVRNIPVTPNQKYPIVVGSGGTAGAYPEPPEYSGEGTFVYGSVGSMGSSSSAFGYTSDDSAHFLYQLKQSYTYVNGSSNTSSSVETYSKYTTNVNGSISVDYETEGTFRNDNGAPALYHGLKYYNSTQGFTQGNGLAGMVVIYY